MKKPSSLSAAAIRRLTELFTVRKRNYQLCFGSPAGQAVLGDLAPFCRAIETCAVPGDEHRTWLLEGRREVWLRIANYLHMTPEQLFALYVRPNEHTGDDE